MACGKTSTLDDNLIEAIELPKKKRGAQEDGTWITSTGEVLPAKNRVRREPYPEPEDHQVDGKQVVVESKDGNVSFLAERMSDAEFRRGGGLERKRQPLRWKVVEVYTKNKPRLTYSWDEIEQIRRGELSK